MLLIVRKEDQVDRHREEQVAKERSGYKRTEYKPPQLVLVDCLLRDVEHKVFWLRAGERDDIEAQA